MKERRNRRVSTSCKYNLYGGILLWPVANKHVLFDNRNCNKVKDIELSITSAQSFNHDNRWFFKAKKITHKLYNCSNLKLSNILVPLCVRVYVIQ